MLVASYSTGVKAASQKEWTFMVFLNGDNSLDPYSDQNLQQMVRVGSSDKVDIIVLRDRSDQNVTSKILHVENGGMTTVKDFGRNIDMGDWHQVVDFFKWTKENFPARHYMMTLWDHGAGWGILPAQHGVRDISWDDHTGNYITTKQMGQAMAEIKTANGGRNLDILGMDACLMQMAEVVHEVGPSVDEVAASEETEPNEGWDYEVALKFLTTTPTAPAKVLADQIEKGFVALSSEDVQGSAVSPSALRAALPAISAFVDALVPFDRLSRSNVTRIMSQTQSFDMPDFKDLIDFTERVKAQTSNAELKDLADAVLTAVHGSIDANYSAGRTMARARGLSIWLPTESEWLDRKAKYATISWGVDSHWTRLLEALYD